MKSIILLLATLTSPARAEAMLSFFERGASARLPIAALAAGVDAATDPGFDGLGLVVDVVVAQPLGELMRSAEDSRWLLRVGVAAAAPDAAVPVRLVLLPPAGDSRPMRVVAEWTARLRMERVDLTELLDGRAAGWRLAVEARGNFLTVMQLKVPSDAFVEPLETAFRSPRRGAAQAPCSFGEAGCRVLVDARRTVVDSVADAALGLPDRLTLGRADLPHAAAAPIDWELVSRAVIGTSARSERIPHGTFGHHVPKELALTGNGQPFNGRLLVLRRGIVVRETSVRLEAYATQRLDMTGLEPEGARDFPTGAEDEDLVFVLERTATARQPALRVALFALRQGLQEAVNPTPRGTSLPY